MSATQPLESRNNPSGNPSTHLVPLKLDMYRLDISGSHAYVCTIN
jgi:hypothetical protein